MRSRKKLILLLHPHRNTNPIPRTPTPSKAFGGGAAAALALLSYVSLQYYRCGHLCKPATTASLALACAVGYAGWGRYEASGGKMMPGGVLVGVSAAMVLFYVWSIMMGPAPGKKAGGKGKGGGGVKRTTRAAAGKRR